MIRNVITRVASRAMREKEKGKEIVDGKESEKRFPMAGVNGAEDN